MSPILGIYASQMSGHLWPASSYESIATTTVGAGGTSTITFSSIPQTYTHLQIRQLFRTSNTSGSNWYSRINFNGDTASNYSFHLVRGNGSTVTSSAGANQTYSVMANSGDSATLTLGWGVGVTDILDYTNTNKYKTIRSSSGYDQNGAGMVDLNSGLWRSTSAITSMVFTLQGGTFQQYSSFALYGIKGVA